MHFYGTIIVSFFLTMGMTYGDAVYHRVMIFYDTPEESQKIVTAPEFTVIHNYSRFTRYIDALIKASDLEKMQKRGMRVNVVCRDMTREEYERVKGGAPFGAYPTTKQIDSAFTYFETTYPAIVKRGVLSEKSFQGRDIFYLKISNSPGADNKKPSAMISFNIHPDEMIGAIQVLVDAEHLCTNYGKDPEITWLVDNRQIFLVGSINVDGYIWNEGKPLGSGKRKNMNLTAGGTESSGGIDLNRNFPYKWGCDNVGSSSNASAMNYRGKGPASESETRAVIEFCNRYFIRTWEIYHSAGDYIALPFGYGNPGVYPPNKNVYFHIGREHQKYYHYKKVGNTADCLGSFRLNGGTEDWGVSDSATHKKYCIIAEIGNTYHDFYNDKPRLLKRCDSLLRCDLYMMQCAGFYPVVMDMKIKDDAPGGNGDGTLNPGETVTLIVRIQNKSVVDTTPDVKTILSSTSTLIQVLDPPGSFGNVEFLDTVDNGAAPIKFKCSSQAKEGDLIRCDLKMAWTLKTANHEKVVPCSLRVGKHTGIELGEGFAVNTGFHIVRNHGTGTVRFRFVASSAVINAHVPLTLRIYNAAGQEIQTMEYPVGTPVQSIDWDLSRRMRGIYFVKAQCGGFKSAHRFAVVR